MTDRRTDKAARYFKYVALVTAVAVSLAILITGVNSYASETGYNPIIDERYEEEWYQTCSEYPILPNVLAKEGSYNLPGLEQTHYRKYNESDNVFNGNLCEFMVPQGITIVDDYILLTSYCSHNEHPSVIYVLNKNTGNYITTISLFENNGSPACELDGDSFAGCEPCINHVGGIEYDRNSRIYVAKSLDRKVSVISKDRLLDAIGKAKANQTDAFAMTFDNEVSFEYKVSYLTWYNDLLFVGVFAEDVTNALHGFSISEEDGVLSATEQISYPVAVNTNGACFYNTHGRDCLAVTSSHGRSKDSQLVLYEVNFSASSSSRIRKMDTYTTPPLSEELCIDNGRMYSIYESGATEYSDPERTKDKKKRVCEHIVDRICIADAEDVFYWPAYEALHADDDTASTAGAVLDSSEINENAENLVDTIKDVNGNYYKDGTTSTIATGFAYSDNMLLCDSTAGGAEGYTDLTKMGVALAAAAYSDNNIKPLLKGMGCDKINLYNYSVTSTYEDNDRVAFSVAQKVVFIEGERYVFYVVPVRGTYRAEWYSDFNLGRSGTHEGFNLAYDQIIDVLKEDFFNSDDADSSHRKIFLTGHSRGAAVANLLAGKLTAGSYIDQSGVFAYTFACPSVSKSASVSYNNIFNFNYEGDLIPTLPLESWGYKRYGVTINYTMDSNSRFRFQEVYGNAFSGDSQTPSGVLDVLRTIVTSEDVYHNDDNKLLFDVVAYVLNTRHASGEWKQILKKHGWDALDELIAKAFGDLSGISWFQKLKIENDTWVELRDEIAAGIELWETEYSKKESYGNTTEERWASWKADYSELLQKISDHLDYTVTLTEHLYEAKAIVRDHLLTYNSKPVATITNVIGMLVATDGNPKAAIQHGHTPETYVSAMNSKYFGFRGWMNSSETFADASNPAITTIGEECFKNCSNLKTTRLSENLKEIRKSAYDSCTEFLGLTIPDSVETIGMLAFNGCTSMEFITIPISTAYDCNSATTWGSYYQSFRNCTNVSEIHYTKGNGTVMRYAEHCGYGSAYQNGLPYIAMQNLLTVTFEEGITEIPENFLRDCNKVNGTVLPDSVETIGESAFQNCSALTEMDFPEGLSSIGAYAFSGCSGLQSLEFPSSITEIPEYCFDGCYGVKRLVIPDSMETIGKLAFSGCTGLEYVKIPFSTAYDCNSATTWSSHYQSFRNCENVSEIHYTKGNGTVMRYAEHCGYGTAYQNGLPYIAMQNLLTVTFEEGITEIPENFLRDCNKVNGTVLPSTVEMIGESAFQNCIALTEMDFPSGLNSIGAYAFSGCYGLQSLEFPSSMTEIPEYCFNGCYGVKSLVIPDSMETIGKLAFNGCTGLTYVQIPFSTVYDCNITDSWSSTYHSFRNCTNVSEIHYTKGNGTVMRYKEHCGYGTPYQYGLPYTARENLLTVTFEEGITEIPENFLRDCNKVNGTVLPSTVEMIGESAFQNCIALTEMDFPSGLNSIGAYAFSGCYGLQSLEFPSSMTEIPEYCFDGCYGVKRLVIPDSMETIGKLAFNGCTGLTYVQIPFSTAYDCNITDSWSSTYHSFRNCTNVSEIHYTKGNGTVMRYKEHCGYGTPYQYGLPYTARENLLTVTFEKGITEIPENFLRDCNKVNGTVLPSTVEMIGESAFQNCIALTEMDFPAGLNSIGAYAFSGCYGLQSLEFPSSMTEIPEYCFNGCYGVKSLVIPDSMETIGKLAFNGCTGLTYVQIPFSTAYDCNITDSWSSTYHSFKNCINVREIYFTKGNGTVMRYAEHCGYGTAYQNSLPYIAMQNLLTVTFEEGITEIPENFLRDCPYANVTVLPSTLQTIGEYAFYNCRLGAELELPSSLQSIGNYALNCSTLTDLLIPPAVTEIGDASPVKTSVIIYGERASAANIYADAKGNTFVPIYEPVITVENTTMYAGESQQLEASIQTGIHTFETQPEWFIQECSSENTTIDATGLLSLDAEETGPVTVGATYKGHSAFAEIEVIPNRKLADCMVVLEQTEYEYDGTAKEPAVTVTYGEELLTENEDYIVTYQDNIEAGEASVTILPAEGSHYIGSQTVTFLITGESEALKQLKAEIVICDEIAISDVAYTLESFTAFTQALDAAKAVVVKEDATDEDYQAAYEALVEAKNGLTVQPACEHLWDEGKVEKAPTCTEDGSLLYTCTLCGETMTESIPMLGHKPGEPVYTWSDDNLQVTAQILCERDPSHILEKETVDTVIEEIASECSVDGNIRYTAEFANSAFETQIRDVVTEAEGHTASDIIIENEKAATCTEDGSYDEVIYCTVCQAEISRKTVVVTATGHVPGDIVIENEIKPTDESEGSYEEVIYCTACGAELSRDIVIVPMVEKADLRAAISAANEALASVVVSKDGSDVLPSLLWVTQAELDVLNDAAQAAQTVADTRDASQTEVNAAENALESALAEFESAKKAGTKPTVIPITKIVMKRTSAEMATKSNLQLQVTYSPSNTTQTGITWSSSNPEVATVDQNGMVTALTRGTVTITATSKEINAKKATCKITVKYLDAYYNLDGSGVSNVTKEMETAIYWAANNKITGEKVKFGTNNSLSRGQFVRFLHRYAGEPKVTSAMIKKYGSQFSDVDKNYTHYKAIVWAVSEGLIGGYSDGTFRPEGTLTRSNVATILWKYAGSPKVSNANNPFTDVSKSTAIAWGKSKKIFTGTKFEPKANCLRGDFALFLYRYDKNVGQ